MLSEVLSVQLCLPSSSESSFITEIAVRAVTCVSDPDLRRTVESGRVVVIILAVANFRSPRIDLGIVIANVAGSVFQISGKLPCGLIKLIYGHCSV